MLSSPLEDWRLFLKDFDDLTLVRVIHDLRGHPDDKDYLYEALRELLDRQRRATSRARRAKNKAEPQS